MERKQTRIPAQLIFSPGLRPLLMLGFPGAEVGCESRLWVHDSHCVIVVDVGEDANGPCVHTIGGNEGNSVGLTRLPLNNGLLVPRSENPYISIVKMG